MIVHQIPETTVYVVFHSRLTETVPSALIWPVTGVGRESIKSTSTYPGLHALSAAPGYAVGAEQGAVGKGQTHSFIVCKSEEDNGHCFLLSAVVVRCE